MMLLFGEQATTTSDCLRDQWQLAPNPTLALRILFAMALIDAHSILFLRIGNARTPIYHELWRYYARTSS